MAEAVSEPPAEGRSPVGEGGGAELPGRVRGEAALPMCYEFGPPQNPPAKSRGPEMAPRGISFGLPLWLKRAGTLSEGRNRVLVNLSPIGGVWLNG